MSLMRLLADHGLSPEEIDRGLTYVEIMGAHTMRQGFVLAMSRVLYSDDQLAEGVRFTFAENLADAPEPAGASQAKSR